MFTVKACLAYRANSDGTHTILLRVTINRKHKYKTLIYSVKKKNWNSKPKLGNDNVWNYVKGDKRHKIINEYISEEISKAKEKLRKFPNLTLEHVPELLKEITNHIDEKEKTSEEHQVNNSFFAYADKVVERKASKNYETGRQYRSAVAKFKKFLDDKDLDFSEINHDLLESYRVYLYAIPNDTNTIHTAMKRIRTILYSAIKEGHFPQEKNPFFTFKLETKKKSKTALTQIELQKIIDLDLTENSLFWHVRNFFLLSYYMHGIRVRDFIQLKKKNFQEGRLIYQMSKTNGSRSIKLPEQAIVILQEYLKEGLRPDDYIFPLLSNERDYSDMYYFHRQLGAKNALINKYLKKIAEQAGIDKNISFHIARHTFSNIARSKIKDISKIQRMLNHGDIRTTQIYLECLPDYSLDEDSDNIYS